jgi:hypothetical protein
LPTTVFHGISASAWNMKLVPAVIPSTGFPPTLTVPALGRSSPATIVSEVDLPHPLGPTTAQNFPAPTVISKSRTAVNSDPDGVAKRFVTPFNSICAAGAGPLRWRAPRAARERLANVLATVIISLAG